MDGTMITRSGFLCRSDENSFEPFKNCLAPKIIYLGLKIGFQGHIAENNKHKKYQGKMDGPMFTG